ncbi:MAG: helix-turn-helix domain-containing protein [Oscillospiraceae bacterium]|jgi:AraC-like DNA-binding protein/DNA gyrase inhibitor GyrI|nr:helix-turn-helix domain-containing protein [Oscillospiraceae bacterium]
MITTREPVAQCKPVDKLRYIREVLPYIEKHLDEELGPEHIAGRHFVSTSQLYRDFYACTGHSVKEYIRKRRISNACEKIKCSDLPLAIIADESGLQTQQAFNKLFKSVVGMTPVEYRQGDTYFYFYPVSVGEISLAVKVGKETIPECETTRFYDSCLVGIEDKAIAALKNTINGEIKGRVFGRNGKQIGNRLCYELMTQQAATGEPDLFATCVVNYNEQEISDGWNYLYNSWLATSMFEESGNGYFEEYIFQNGGPRKLKLYLPVKKRKKEQHISITSISEMSFVVGREKGHLLRGHNAERKASEKVMNFLQEHHPLLIRNAQKFYVCCYDDICECGMECGDAFTLPAPASRHFGSGLEVVHIPAGRYAVLPDDRLGDVRVGAAKLELWLQNNHIAHENMPVFAVYETINGSYDSENIRMKLYKQLKKPNETVQVDKNG